MEIETSLTGAMMRAELAETTFRVKYMAAGDGSYILLADEEGPHPVFIFSHFGICTCSSFKVYFFFLDRVEEKLKKDVYYNFLKL